MNESIHNHMMHMAQANALLKPEDATHTVVKNGAWSDPETWAGGRVPTADANIHIPADNSIIYDIASSPDLGTIRVDGALSFSRSQSTELRVETIVTTPGSVFDVGNMTDEIPAGVEAEIVFRDTPINMGADPEMLGHGLVAFGTVDIQGAEKASHLTIKYDVPKGATSMLVEGDLTNWKAGDTILVVGTEYLGEDRNGVLQTQDETRTIVKVDPDGRVHFDRPLDYAHTHPDGIDADIYVGNLSRNVTFRSENPDGVRGHVMLHNSTPNPEDGSVNCVRFAAFEDLGRTDKTIPISDGNPEGRYPLHLHMVGAGVDAPTNMIVGNAVTGSPGWGIVQHESRAMINDNIVYDITGAGIVSEWGNETGAWMRNLVSSVTGYQLENKNGDGNQGAAYENQSRVIVQQDNIAANSKLGWNFSGQEHFPEDEGRTGSPKDGAHRKMFEREQLKFDPSPFDVAIDHEEPAIVDFIGNEVIGASEGFRVYHRQFADDTDTMSVITDFTVWGGKSAIYLKNYSSNYEFVDSVLQGSGEGFRVDPKTSGVVFNNVEFRDFGTGFRSFGVNHETVLIDVDFINVRQNFKLEDLMKNISNESLKRELTDYYRTNYNIDYTNPMPKIVDSSTITPLDKVYFVADPGSDLNAADGTLNIRGTIYDSIGPRTFNEYVIAKSPSGSTSGKEIEGVTLRFGSFAKGQQIEFSLEEFVAVHGTWKRADGVWIVPVVNWITDRLTVEQHPVVIDVELRGWSDERARPFALDAYPDPSIENSDFDYGFAIRTADGSVRDTEPAPAPQPKTEPEPEPTPAPQPQPAPAPQPDPGSVQEPQPNPEPTPQTPSDTATQFWDSMPGVILGTSQNDRVFGTNSDDILVGGLGSDKVRGRDGADSFVLSAVDAAFGAVDDIKDFSLLQGDSVAITGVSDALAAADPNSWMRFVKVGTLGELQVNVDGSGFEALAIFRNGRELTVDQLMANGKLAVYGDGGLTNNTQPEPSGDNPRGAPSSPDDGTDTAAPSGDDSSSTDDPVVDNPGTDPSTSDDGAQTPEPSTDTTAEDPVIDDSLSGLPAGGPMRGTQDADVFSLHVELAALGEVTDVKDFSIDQGDSIKIAGVPGALTSAELGSWVRFVKEGTLGDLQVDIDGTGFKTLAIFRNGRELTVDQLTALGQLTITTDSGASFGQATSQPGPAQVTLPEPTPQPEPEPAPVTETIAPFWEGMSGVILGMAQDDTVIGTSGNDILVGGDVLRGRDGADTFVLTAEDAAIGAVDDVKDFSLPQGDGVAITGVSDALAAADPNSWMRFVKVGTLGELQVNIDGNGFAALAIFRNGRELTVDQLMANGKLAVYGDGGFASVAPTMLVGDANANRLEGFSGTQIIDGRGGNDVLSGGPDNDTFVFANGGGNDRVLDFTQGDLLDVSGMGITALSDFDQIVEYTDRTTLVEGNDSITLVGIAVSDLSEGSFVFL